SDDAPERRAPAALRSDRSIRRQPPALERDKAFRAASQPASVSAWRPWFTNSHCERLALMSTSDRPSAPVSHNILGMKYEKVAMRSTTTMQAAVRYQKRMGPSVSQ